MPEYQERGVVWEDLEIGDLISTIHWFVSPDEIKKAAESFYDDNLPYFDKDFAKDTERRIQ